MNISVGNAQYQAFICISSSCTLALQGSSESLCSKALVCTVVIWIRGS